MQKNKFAHSLFTLLLILGSSIFLTACINKPPASENQQTSEEEQSPSSKVEIEDGNVIQINNGKKSILVNKNDFEEINEFTEVHLSPDGSKICFLGQSIVPIWMFSADANGSNVNKIAVAKNCVWSPDSQKIAYNNHTTDVSPVDVFVYDLSQKSKLNLTATTQQISIIRVYDLPAWSADSTKITSQFGGIDFDNFDNEVKGSSVIDLITKEIEDN